jgi:hypothetical protein
MFSFVLFLPYFKDLLTRKWVKVSQATAKEKVGQAFRDLVKARRAARKEISKEALFSDVFEQSPSASEASFINPVSFGMNESQTFLGFDSSDDFAALSSNFPFVGQTWTPTEVEPMPLEESYIGPASKKDQLMEVMDQQEKKRRRCSTGFASCNFGTSLVPLPSCECRNTEISSWPVHESLEAENSSLTDFGCAVFWPTRAEFKSTKSKKRSLASRSA